MFMGYPHAITFIHILFIYFLARRVPPDGEWVDEKSVPSRLSWAANLLLPLNPYLHEPGGLSASLL